MKHTLLTVGAAFILLPFFSADARAEHYLESATTEPTILLRCHKTPSTESYSYEEEQYESHRSHSETFSERYESRESPIREILRRRETRHRDTHSEKTPIVIEIQGDCDAIRVGRGARSQEELFPGELNQSSDYEEWQEDLYEYWQEEFRDRHGGASGSPHPWLIRPGSGWDWLLRSYPDVRDSVVRPSESGEQTTCLCVQAPCNPCATFSSP